LSRGLSYQNKEIYVDEKKILSRARIEGGKSGSQSVTAKGKLSLSKEEHNILKKLKTEQLSHIRSEVEARFDSNKNWSIMIDPKNNEIRNKVMQKIKYEQVKRRVLHDFSRKAKESLIKQREEKQREQF